MRFYSISRLRKIAAKSCCRRDGPKRQAAGYTCKGARVTAASCTARLADISASSPLHSRRGSWPRGGAGGSGSSGGHDGAPGARARGVRADEHCLSHGHCVRQQGRRVLQTEPGQTVGVHAPVADAGALAGPPPPSWRVPLQIPTPPPPLQSSASSTLASLMRLRLYTRSPRCLACRDSSRCGAGGGPAVPAALTMARPLRLDARRATPCCRAPARPAAGHV